MIKPKEPEQWFEAILRRVLGIISNIKCISVKDMEDMTLDELDELEDEEEERILEQYRQARMAEIKSLQAGASLEWVNGCSCTHQFWKGLIAPINFCW